MKLTDSIKLHVISVAMSENYFQTEERLGWVRIRIRILLEQRKVATNDVNKTIPQGQQNM